MAAQQDYGRYRKRKYETENPQQIPTMSNLTVTPTITKVSTEEDYGMGLCTEEEYGMKLKAYLSNTPTEINIEKFRDMKRFTCHGKAVVDRFDLQPGKRLCYNLEKFRDVKKFTCHGKAVEDWFDLQPGKRPCYNLYFLEDNADLLYLGRSIFTELMGSMTARTVATLMLLAYNLKDRAGARIFNPIPLELQDVNSIDFDEISRMIIKTGSANLQVIEAISFEQEDLEKKLCTGYCYLAASYLRLYTKSISNYTKIETSLRKKFAGLYGYALPFEIFHPDEDTIKAIKVQFDFNSILRATFYNFLYSGEENKYGTGIKSFLYNSHVNGTGMHAYTLFLKCMVAIPAENVELLAVFDSKVYNSEVQALKTVFNTLHDSGNVPGKELQMWRYARIFDQSFMSILQTKNCAVFVACLANILKLSATDNSNQDVMNIVHVASLPLLQKRLANAVAHTVIRIFKSRG